jgi:hypothetical protein
MRFEPIYAFLATGRFRAREFVIASEAKQSIFSGVDCFVASLLAMTRLVVSSGRALTRSLTGRRLRATEFP